MVCADEKYSIEITAEMIEAGADVLERVDGIDLGRGYAETVTKRIVRAALKAAAANSQDPR